MIIRIRFCVQGIRCYVGNVDKLQEMQDSRREQRKAPENAQGQPGDWE